MLKLKNIFFYGLVATSLFFAGRLFANTLSNERDVAVTPLEDIREFEARMDNPEQGHLYLVAQQWEWSDQLDLKVGKEYQLHVTSADIMHSLYIPKRVSGKSIEVLLVPGNEYTILIKAINSGLFPIGCNEYCGLSHNKMRGFINVMK